MYSYIAKQNENHISTTFIPLYKCFEIQKSRFEAREIELKVGTNCEMSCKAILRLEMDIVM